MTQRLFLQGLLAGASGTLLGGAALLYTLARLEVIRLHDTMISAPGDWLAWAYTNLGSSIPVFAGLLLAFFITLGRLRRCLDDDRPVEKVVQLDQLTDIWTTLFFGTGVIWTAIGMRSALIFALGDRDVALQDGAFAMLERMIDGGILLALSTTIFGGVGGYLMRAWKALRVGAELTRYYEREGSRDLAALRASVSGIEYRLRALGDSAPGSRS
jgi:hypothetical protein